jgi:phage shock protein A
MPEKSYVLRRIRIEQGVLESRVSQFASEVSQAELSVVNTVEDLRNLEARLVADEERHTLISVKVEGVGAEFQVLQNQRKPKQDEVDAKSGILIELIDEQVNLEKRITETKAKIKKQKSTVSELRKTLTGMKNKLREAEDTKNDLVARYNTVQAMDKADATLALLESGSHSETVQMIEGHVRKREALAQGRKEVRSLSEDEQFAELEHDMAVSEKLEKYTNKMKGIA